jgi:hypothetical protein
MTAVAGSTPRIPSNVSTTRFSTHVRVTEVRAGSRSSAALRQMADSSRSIVRTSTWIWSSGRRLAVITSSG